MKEETTQIFTPENIREFIGRKVILKYVDSIACYSILRASGIGAAAFIRNEYDGSLERRWVEMKELNDLFLDFVADEKNPTSSASPIDELMDGFFAEMERLKIGTVQEQVEVAKGKSVTTKFAFSVDGKEHTDKTVHEIFAKRFGVPFYPHDTGAGNCE